MKNKSETFFELIDNYSKAMEQTANTIIQLYANELRIKFLAHLKKENFTEFTSLDEEFEQFLKRTLIKSVNEDKFVEAGCCLSFLFNLKNEK